MQISTTPKEKAAGGLHTKVATAINDRVFPAVERNNKAMFSLRVAYALKSHALQRTDRADSPVTYQKACPGIVKHLSPLYSAGRVREQVGVQP